VIVILEGTDGVGKTTAAQQLASRGDHVALLHPGPPVTDDPYREYLHPLVWLCDLGYDVVCDRWHIGELVWPVVFKRPPIMNLAQMHEIEDALMMLKTSILLVHVVADVGWLETISKYRHDEENLTQTVQAMAAFTNVINQSTLHHITCTRNTVIEEVTQWRLPQSVPLKP